MSGNILLKLSTDTSACAALLLLQVADNVRTCTLCQTDEKLHLRQRNRVEEIYSDQGSNGSTKKTIVGEIQARSHNNFEPQ